MLQYFRRRDKQDSGSKSPQENEADKQSVVAVENAAFLASNDSIAVEQNADDNDNGHDGQNRVDGNDEANKNDDTYGNIESKRLSKRTNIY